jgi:hypothetical protein
MEVLNVRNLQILPEITFVTKCLGFKHQNA